MAEKRMISKQIIDSDTFLDMPLSAQALYFHLLMRADDDGFVDNSKKIVRMICASEDDLKLLIAKRYLLVFETGVVVVKHWRVHNYIAKDRYNTTSHTSEYSMLDLLPNKEYSIKSDYAQDYPQTFPQVENGNNSESFAQDNTQTFPQTFPQNSKSCIQSVYTASTECIQDVDNPDTNCSHRLDKIREDKKRLDKSRLDEDRAAAAAESSSSSSPEEDEILEAVIAEFGRALPGLKAPAKVEKLKGLICGRSLDYFRELFAKAAESPFLSEVREGQWSCSLEWLMKPDNSEKVMSGMYARYKPPRTDPEPSQTYTSDAGVMEGFDTTTMFEAALRRGMAGGGKA